MCENQTQNQNQQQNRGNNQAKNGQTHIKRVQNGKNNKNQKFENKKQNEQY